MTSDRRLRVVFLMSKDPVLERGGDVEMTHLAMKIAAEEFDVSVICLSAESGSTTADLIDGGLPVTRIAKPVVSPLALVRDSLKTRRSLVHVRFDTAELRAAIDRSDADVFVAEHSYMAEAFLHSAQAGAKRFVVSTHVSESVVWRASRGLLGRLEGPRLVRDELRVARAADAVGMFDADEAEFYRANGVPTARWLDVTLPPGRRVDPSVTPPRLVFLGTRAWAPNQEAFERALELWPQIAEGIDDAELVVVGAKNADAGDRSYPRGVRDLGFVDDLQALLGTCRAMMAPIRVGGGVRVKLLEAASIGLPFVGTHAAVGSMQTVFGLTPSDDDDAFVAECRRMLSDPAAAAQVGTALYEANRLHWEQRRPQRSVQSLIHADTGT